jgi:3-hydroxymyristoyl/3-hydroxydecanoyl-(acyl carrier protein) dehydratase
MQLQPEILSEEQQGSRLHLQLRVPSALEHFNGHFPGLPILPGVVQLDWAIRIATRHYAIEPPFSALENLKFQAPVRPDLELSLELDWDANRGRLEFLYRAGARKYSSGRIRFGAQQ